MQQADDWNRLYAVLATIGLPQPVLNMPHPDHGTKQNPHNGKHRTLPLAWPHIKVGIGWDYTDTKAWERSDWTLVVLSSAIARDLPPTLVWLHNLLTDHHQQQPKPPPGNLNIAPGTVPALPKMEADDWDRLYRLLAACQLPQPAFGLLQPDQPDNPLPFGWPDLRIGICFDITDQRPWLNDNWSLHRLSTATARTLAPSVAFFDDLMFAHILRNSETTADQSVSKTERKVLDPLLRAGLPNPERNLEIRNEEGRLLTIPDFVWTFPNGNKLAIMVDGHMFHSAGGEFLRDMAKLGKNRKRALKERVKSKAAKDAETRTWMQARGWTVLAIGDGTVDEGGKAFADAIDNIVSTYRNLQAA